MNDKVKFVASNENLLFEEWCKQVFIALVSQGLYKKDKDEVYRPSHGIKDAIFILGHEDTVETVAFKINDHDILEALHERRHSVIQ